MPKSLRGDLEVTHTHPLGALYCSTAIYSQYIQARKRCCPPVDPGYEKTVLNPQRPLSGINYLRVLDAALSNIYFTQTHCIIASDILAVRGLAIKLQKKLQRKLQKLQSCFEHFEEAAAKAAGCLPSYAFRFLKNDFV